MTGRVAAAVALGLMAATVARAQTRPSVELRGGAAGFGKLGPGLGLDARLERPTWEGGVAFGGQPGSRWERAAAFRLGMAAERGPFRWSLGALGLESSLGGLGGGVFGSGRFRVGRLLVTGEVGQIATVSGAWQLSSGATAADTGRKGSARRLGHGVLGGQWRRGAVELNGRLIRRSRLAPDDRAGWEVGVGVLPISGLRLGLSVGRAPIGPSLYLPFRNQITFGLSWAERRPRRAEAATGGAASLPGFDVTRRNSGLVAIVVRIPGARSVELVADFSDWRPLPLTARGSGVFAAEVPLAPGVYLVNLRVDGGPLQVPAGLEGVDDGFGGRVGVLVVR